MQYLGFDEMIEGTIELVWQPSMQQTVSHVFIHPDSNHDAVELLGLSVGNWLMASAGTPLAWLSAERGMTGSLGQPLGDGNGIALRLQFGQVIKLTLHVPRVYGKVRVRGCFVVTNSLTFQASSRSLESRAER